MITIFEMRDGQPMPDYFVERYEPLIAEWAERFREFGGLVTIELDEAGFVDMNPRPEFGPIVRGVDLEALVERRPTEHRVTIRPASEESDEALRKHVEKMQRLRVPAWLRVVRAS